MEPPRSGFLPQPDPACVIVDREVKGLYESFVDAVCGMHADVRLETTRLEKRLFLRDTLLCRIAAYRELFHVQIGKTDVWEIRVRNRATCSDALDRVLTRFLEVYIAGQREREPEPPRTV